MYRGIHRRIRKTALCVCIACCAWIAARAQNTRYTDSLLNAIDNTKIDTVKVNLLLDLSRAYRQVAVTRQFYYANKALALAEKTKWETGKMYAEQLTGDCYLEVMAYNDAIVHLKLCIDAARKLKRSDVAARCQRLIVHCYHEMKDLQQALVQQGIMCRQAEQMGDPTSICNHNRTYALCLSDVGRYEEAIRHLQQNIGFAEASFTGTQKKDVVSDLLNTLATTYIWVNKKDSALGCLRAAAHLAAQTNNDTANVYITSSFCDVYAYTRQYDSAIIYGKRTLELNKVTHDINLEQRYCELLSQLYEGDHQPIPALFYYKKYDSLTKMINATHKTANEAMQVAKIKMEQQAERNDLEKRSMEALSRNQQAAITAGAVAMLALIALTTFVYRNLRQKQKTNKTISLQAKSLQEQNELIDKALKEKEVLLKETHHRVKNNLQLISSLLELQAESINDEGAKNALRTAQRRVLSIATVHSKLYGGDETETIDFSAFASDLFGRLNGAFSSTNGDVAFTNSMPPTFLPLNTVVLLGLILNELIANSFKHAFAGVKVPAVYMGIEIRDTIYTLRYSDNGPGLPQGVFDADRGSLGLYLVRRLSKQIKGTATYKYEGGSTFTITFPYGGN